MKRILERLDDIIEDNKDLIPMPHAYVLAIKENRLRSIAIFDKPSNNNQCLDCGKSCRQKYCLNCATERHRNSKRAYEERRKRNGGK